MKSLKRTLTWVLSLGLVTLLPISVNAQSVGKLMEKVDKLNRTKTSYTPPRQNIPQSSTPISLIAFTISNKFDKSIQCAVVYKKDGKDWTVTKWFTLAPGENKEFKTKNVIAYVAARSADGKTIWGTGPSEFAVEGTKYRFNQHALKVGNNEINIRKNKDTK